MYSDARATGRGKRGRSWRSTAAGIALALIAAPCGMRGQCPASTVQISVTVSSDANQETTTYRCRRLDRLTPGDLARISPQALDLLSPADRKQVVFLRQLQDTDQRYQPIQAPITSDTSDRSAYQYSKVIEQFRVDESRRYAPDVWTYCNIFVWDVTRAMNTEIPLTSVNKMVGWLNKQGQTHGWRRVDLRMAQQMADEGRPSVAIASSIDPKEHGHVVVIRPGSVGDSRGAAISQAGRLAVDASHIDSIPGFTNPENLDAIQYWYHE
jgi:hypothetical protein